METKEATPTPEAPAAIPPPLTMSALWQDYFKPFAATIGKPLEEVTAALLPLVGEASDEMAAAVADSAVTSDDQIKSAFSSFTPPIPPVKMNKAIQALRKLGAPKAEPVAPAATPSVMTPTAMTSLLAPLPTTESVLAGLSTVRVGLIERDVVARGIQVALAERAGLFRVPRLLLAMMDRHVTERMEEPAPPKYFELEDAIAAEDNADVLRLLKVSGRFTSRKNKDAFLNRINGLWKPVREFQRQVRLWQENYVAAAGNPTAMMQMLTMAATGGLTGGSMASTMVTTPDTAALHDGAQLVLQAINYAFAGKFIPAAMALAYDAERINQFLRDPEIPHFTGCTNREELARTLSNELKSTIVTPDYNRLEQTLMQYVLSVYELDKLAPKGTPQEMNFLVALFQLGQSIQWERLFDGTNDRDDGRRPEPHPVGGLRDGRPQQPFPSSDDGDGYSLSPGGSRQRNR